MPVQESSQNLTTPASQRGSVRFSVEGLSARDELLFKSMVRLLDQRTHQRRFYSTEKVQLRVVGEGFLPLAGKTRLPEWSAERASVLVVGHSQPQDVHFLHLPLHAHGLELMLNKLGPQLASFDAAPASPVSPGGSFGDEEAFVLLKWPPVALLGTPARIRLATLMRGKPMTALLLQKRSGFSAQECADFIDALLRAQLLSRVGASLPAGGQPQNLAAAPPSLATALESSEKNAADLANGKVSSGLLERIRRRLGLFVPPSV